MIKDNPKKCLGCGALLSLDSNSPGYALSLEHDYCYACYKLKHYGEVEKHHHPKTSFKVNPGSVVIFVTSIMYIDLAFTYNLKSLNDDVKIIYLVNQIDLLPKNTNLDILYKNLRTLANSYQKNYLDIILMSAKNNQDIINLDTYLKELKSNDIYLMGIQNSGKTSIYNALTKTQKALAINKAGLTQEIINTRLGNFNLYDMPGYYVKGYLNSFIPYEEYKKLLPAKEIKPIINQLKIGQSLIIEDLIAVNYIKGESKSFVFYGNSKIHKTNQVKSETFLTNKNILTWTKSTYKLATNDKYQLSFGDLGFYHIKGEAILEIIHPKGLHITLIKAVFR